MGLRRKGSIREKFTSDTLMLVVAFFFLALFALIFNYTGDLQYFLALVFLAVFVIFIINKKTEIARSLFKLFLWAFLFVLIILLLYSSSDYQYFEENLGFIALNISFIAFVMSIIFAVQSGDDNSKIMKRFDELEESRVKIDNVQTLLQDMSNKYELLNPEIKEFKEELKNLHSAIENLSNKESDDEGK